jgi:MerR family transcriptional regulator/heat shock protein HspR
MVRKKVTVHIAPDEAVYVISAVSHIVHIPVWTLRILDREGIIQPKRKGKKTRFYCFKDIERLEYVHYLMEEKGINISGIKFILQAKT